MQKAADNGNSIPAWGFRTRFRKPPADNETTLWGNLTEKHQMVNMKGRKDGQNIWQQNPKYQNN